MEKARFFSFIEHFKIYILVLKDVLSFNFITNFSP